MIGIFTLSTFTHSSGYFATMGNKLEATKYPTEIKIIRQSDAIIIGNRHICTF